MKLVMSGLDGRDQTRKLKVIMCHSETLSSYIILTLFCLYKCFSFENHKKNKTSHEIVMT